MFSSPSTASDPSSHPILKSFLGLFGSRGRSNGVAGGGRQSEKPHATNTDKAGFTGLRGAEAVLSRSKSQIARRNPVGSREAPSGQHTSMPPPTDVTSSHQQYPSPPQSPVVDATSFQSTTVHHALHHTSPIGDADNLAPPPPTNNTRAPSAASSAHIAPSSRSRVSFDDRPQIAEVPRTPPSLGSLGHRTAFWKRGNVRRTQDADAIQSISKTPIDQSEASTSNPREFFQQPDPSLRRYASAGSLVKATKSRTRPISNPGPTRAVTDPEKRISTPSAKSASSLTAESTSSVNRGRSRSLSRAATIHGASSRTLSDQVRHSSPPTIPSIPPSLPILPPDLNPDTLSDTGLARVMSTFEERVAQAVVRRSISLNRRSRTPDTGGGLSSKSGSVSMSPPRLPESADVGRLRAAFSSFEHHMAVLNESPTSGEYGPPSSPISLRASRHLTHVPLASDNPANSSSPQSAYALPRSQGPVRAATQTALSHTQEVAVLPRSRSATIPLARISTGGTGLDSTDASPKILTPALVSSGHIQNPPSPVSGRPSTPSSRPRSAIRQSTEDPSRRSLSGSPAPRSSFGGSSVMYSNSNIEERYRLPPASPIPKTTSMTSISSIGAPSSLSWNFEEGRDLPDLDLQVAPSTNTQHQAVAVSPTDVLGKSFAGPDSRLSFTSGLNSGSSSHYDSSSLQRKTSSASTLAGRRGARPRSSTPSYHAPSHVIISVAKPPAPIPPSIPVPNVVLGHSGVKGRVSYDSHDGWGDAGGHLSAGGNDQPPGRKRMSVAKNVDGDGEAFVVETVTKDATSAAGPDGSAIDVRGGWFGSLGRRNTFRRSRAKSVPVDKATESAPGSVNTGGEPPQPDETAPSSPTSPASQPSMSRPRSLRLDFFGAAIRRRSGTKSGSFDIAHLPRASPISAPPPPSPLVIETPAEPGAVWADGLLIEMGLDGSKLPHRDELVGKNGEAPTDEPAVSKLEKVVEDTRGS
ncbi:hypothetical protein HDU93_004726 [Gonapodya sp. JEL0774]|nr:hypothetical protein HDU93_004726 [Gonapodya sp. JEL0774]